MSKKDKFMKCLIIDDDNSTCAMFKMYFEKFNIKCDVATLGFDGINKFRESLDNFQPYDLLLIDIILPDINGKDVLENIRIEEDLRKLSENEKVKVILTTSLDDEENQKIKENLNSQYESYYVKSFTNEGLDKKLKDLGVKIY